MSSTSKSSQYPSANEDTACAVDGSDSDENPSMGATAPEINSDEEDAKKIDTIIPLFDSKEYQLYQEIEKLALQVKILETRDWMLTKCIGS